MQEETLIQQALVAPESIITKLAKSLLCRQLRSLQEGKLRLVDADSSLEFGKGGACVTLRVHDPRFYGEVLLGGSLGAGESYALGYWSCDDLTALVRLMVANRDLTEAVDSGLSRTASSVLRLAHFVRRNTVRGSARNIAAHYDLGNEFFELFLDDTLAYSCGIFESETATLEQASRAKFDAALGKLRLKPSDQLLEIGTGWGGLAIHAARHYGCRVTTATISRRQFELARERVQRAGLEDKVTVLLKDYRELRGRFDALISIEMVEAVGHQYLDGYFAICSKLLKPEGAMLLQAITIRDQLYRQALRSVDFIKRHIFPGSFIPSVAVLIDSVARRTDLKLSHLEDLGPHYARTLKIWRQRLLARREEARRLGYSDSFLRMWEYYLCYCEGGFEERQLGDVQMLLTKPNSRRAAIATVHAPPA
ncbi:MAG TPA: cyclopropane-fatty-acyl-phospholipid synthase family protein [Steroidobacteraceae bacterium]|jgi:cyclopropane-fatty-acyl-phospholipid synthase